MNQLFSMEKNYNTNLPLAFLFSNNFSTMWLYSSPPATPESFVSFSFTATQIPLLERSLSSSSKAWKKWGKICYWKVTQSRQVHIIVMTLPKKSGKCIGKKKRPIFIFLWLFSIQNHYSLCTSHRSISVLSTNFFKNLWRNCKI